MAGEKPVWMKGGKVDLVKFRQKRQPVNAEQTAGIIFQLDLGSCEKFTIFAQAMIDNPDGRSEEEINGLLGMWGSTHDVALGLGLHWQKCAVMLGVNGRPVKS